jgi:hypothetical protein
MCKILCCFTSSFFLTVIIIKFRWFVKLHRTNKLNKVQHIAHQDLVSEAGRAGESLYLHAGVSFYFVDGAGSESTHIDTVDTVSATTSVSGVVHSVHIQMRSSISSYGVEFQALI